MSATSSGLVSSRLKRSRMVGSGFQVIRSRRPLRPMSVDEAATMFDTTWETDASTVGGLVTEALGHIPTGRETVVIGDFEFEVERVRDRIPQSVVIRRVVHVSSEGRR